MYLGLAIFVIVCYLLYCFWILSRVYINKSLKEFSQENGVITSCKKRKIKYKADSNYTYLLTFEYEFTVKENQYIGSRYYFNSQYDPLLKKYYSFKSFSETLCDDAIKKIMGKN